MSLIFYCYGINISFIFIYIASLEESSVLDSFTFILQTTFDKKIEVKVSAILWLFDLTNNVVFSFKLHLIWSVYLKAGLLRTGDFPLWMGWLGGCRGWLTHDSGGMCVSLSLAQYLYDRLSYLFLCCHNFLALLIFKVSILSKYISIFYIDPLFWLLFSILKQSFIVSVNIAHPDSHFFQF
jgi:hypothetical protein